MKKISVVSPRFNPSDFQTPENLPPEGVIYLPADFFDFRISLKRLWMKPAIGKLLLMMNPVGLRPHILTQTPDSFDIMVSEQAVGECGVPEDEIQSYAQAQAVKAIRARHKFLWWEPRIEAADRITLHKIVLIHRQSDHTWLYDTYTGKKIDGESNFFVPGKVPVQAREVGTP